MPLLIALLPDDGSSRQKRTSYGPLSETVHRGELPILVNYSGRPGLNQVDDHQVWVCPLQFGTPSVAYLVADIHSHSRTFIIFFQFQHCSHQCSAYYDSLFFISVSCIKRTSISFSFINCLTRLFLNWSPRQRLSDAILIDILGLIVFDFLLPPYLLC